MVERPDNGASDPTEAIQRSAALKYVDENPTKPRAVAKSVKNVTGVEDPKYPNGVHPNFDLE